MRNYKLDNRIVFNIDDNGDNFDSFQKSVDFIKQIFKPKISEYYPGGWDTSYLYFSIDGIEIKLIFRDFGGTDLSISEDCSESEIFKVSQWAYQIYQEVNKKETL